MYKRQKKEGRVLKNKNFKELMSYAGKYKILTYLSLVLGAISGILALVPFIFIWLIIKEVIEVMPNFTDATNMIHNGWMAVIFALLAMIVNFSALMCSHLSAFRIASNMRIKLLQHITKMPIGKLDEIGTGKLRKNRYWKIKKNSIRSNRSNRNIFSSSITRYVSCNSNPNMYDCFIVYI